MLYIVSMWWAGIEQGMHWRSYNNLGFLQYSFSEIVRDLHPLYAIRALGGLIYLSGVLIMVYNIAKTIAPTVHSVRVTPATAAAIGE